jgi:hypothetical protein
MVPLMRRIPPFIVRTESEATRMRFKIGMNEMNKKKKINEGFFRSKQNKSRKMSKSNQSNIFQLGKKKTKNSKLLKSKTYHLVEEPLDSTLR